MILAKDINILTWFIDDRKPLGNLCIEKIDTEVLRLVATDGYMIMILDIDHKNLPDFDPILITKSDVMKIKEDSTFMTFDNSVYLMGANGDTVICPVVDVEFPNYRKAIHQIFKQPSNQEVDTSRLSIIMNAAKEYGKFAEVLPGGSTDAMIIRTGNAIFGLMPVK